MHLGNRQTDPAMCYSAYVVSAWIGDSLAVAREHDLRLTAAYSELATRRAIPDALTEWKPAAFGQARVGRATMSAPGGGVSEKVGKARASASDLGCSVYVTPVGIRTRRTIPRNFHKSRPRRRRKRRTGPRKASYRPCLGFDHRRLA